MYRCKLLFIVCFHVLSIWVTVQVVAYDDPRCFCFDAVDAILRDDFLCADTFALSGVACTGKTTLLKTLDGTKFNGTTFSSRFLDYAEICKEQPIFASKFGNTYMELAYTLLHHIRSFADLIEPVSTPSNVKDVKEPPQITSVSPVPRSILDWFILTDRSPFDNLVYDILFTFDGHRNFDLLQSKIESFDSQAFDSLTEAELTKIRSVDFAIDCIAAELTRSIPNYHILIVTVNNAFLVSDNLTKRGNPDSNFNVVEYTRSQNLLFKRLVERLPRELCSSIQVDSLIRVEDVQVFFTEIQSYYNRFYLTTISALEGEKNGRTALPVPVNFDTEKNDRTTDNNDVPL